MNTILKIKLPAGKYGIGSPAYDFPIYLDAIAHISRGANDQEVKVYPDVIFDAGSTTTGEFTLTANAGVNALTTLINAINSKPGVGSIPVTGFDSVSYNG